MKKLDELEKWCDKNKLYHHVKTKTYLELIKTIRAQHEALKEYGYPEPDENGTAWFVGKIARIAVEQTEQDWGNVTSEESE